jgi:hypothetical protein
MGNSCGCGSKEKPPTIDIPKLITMQNLWRKKQAMKLKE